MRLAVLDHPDDSCYGLAHSTVVKVASWWKRRSRDLSDPRELLSGLYSQDAEATTAFVERMTPVVQRRIAWILHRRREQGGRNRRVDLLDFVQDAFVRLFDADFKVLRSWDPDRGAPLESFVALVAERTTISTIRSGKRGAWLEDPVADDTIDERLSATQDPEALLANRQLLTTLLERLRIELPPRGMELFIALFVDERPPEDVAKELGMTMNALYTWRSRVRKLVGTWVQEEEARLERSTGANDER